MMQGDCIIALKFQIPEKRGRQKEWKIPELLHLEDLLET
jgi:hypothetical protein